MKKHSFLVGAFILTVGGLLAKVLGALYKIPLTNLIGTNGMGVYYLIFPLYSLLFVLVSSGISLGVTKLVSEERGKKSCRKNEKMILRAGLVYVIIFSSLLAILIVSLSGTISNFQGNINARFGYMAIAPALIFASVIAVFRGYFQGMENMLPTSISNVVEQLIKLMAGLLLANMFLHRGVLYGVLGAILGITLSELFAFVFMLINYIVYVKKNEHIFNEYNNDNAQLLTFRKAFSRLVRYSFATTLTSLIVPATAFLDSFMIINILMKSGFSSVSATSLYGISNGIVNNLISLPVLIMVSLATVILPNLSKLYSEKNMKEINFRCSLFTKLAWLIALPCFIYFLILSPDIIKLLYGSGLNNTILNEFEYSYKLLMISSVSLLYYAFLQTFTSILQSIDKPLLPFISLSTGLVVRTILVVVLVAIPQVNIFGLVFANIVFLLISSIVNLLFLRKFVSLKFSFRRMFLYPVFSASVMGGVLYILRQMFGGSLNWFTLVLCAGVTGLLYMSLVFVLRCFTPAERRCFPMMRKVMGKEKKAEKEGKEV